MQTYSLLLGVGALSGLLLACWRAPQKELSCYMSAGAWALVGTLIGSRAVAVMINFPYYQAHPGEIIQVWMGGLSGIGALIGGVISVFIVAKWKNIDRGAMADAVFPLAGTVMVTAWLGCWIGRCSYGFPSEAWWAMPVKDEFGVLANRIPVQLIGAFSTLAIVWVLELATKRFPTCGLSALIGLFALSTEMFLISFLRADPAPMVNGMRLDAWGALGLMAFSALGALIMTARLKLIK
jgi:phosphatidylglycerol:prolipoprotein diacylglycerol transferase